MVSLVYAHAAGVQMVKTVAEKLSFVKNQPVQVVTATPAFAHAAGVQMAAMVVKNLASFAYASHLRAPLLAHADVTVQRAGEKLPPSPVAVHAPDQNTQDLGKKALKKADL